MLSEEDDLSEHPSPSVPLLMEPTLQPTAAAAAAATPDPSLQPTAAAAESSGSQISDNPSAIPSKFEEDEEVERSEVCPVETEQDLQLQHPLDSATAELQQLQSDETNMQQGNGASSAATPSRTEDTSNGDSSTRNHAEKSVRVPLMREVEEENESSPSLKERLWKKRLWLLAMIVLIVAIIIACSFFRTESPQRNVSISVSEDSPCHPSRIPTYRNEFMWMRDVRRGKLFFLPCRQAESYNRLLMKELYLYLEEAMHDQLVTPSNQFYGSRFELAFMRYVGALTNSSVTFNYLSGAVGRHFLDFQCIQLIPFDFDANMTFPSYFCAEARNEPNKIPPNNFDPTEHFTEIQKLSLSLASLRSPLAISYDGLSSELEHLQPIMESSDRRDVSMLLINNFIMPSTTAPAENNLKVADRFVTEFKRMAEENWDLELVKDRNNNLFDAEPRAFFNIDIMRAISLVECKSVPIMDTWNAEIMRRRVREGQLHFVPCKWAKAYNRLLMKEFYVWMEDGLSDNDPKSGKKDSVYTEAFMQYVISLTNSKYSTVELHKYFSDMFTTHYCVQLIPFNFDSDYLKFPASFCARAQENLPFEHHGNMSETEFFKDSERRIFMFAAVKNHHHLGFYEHNEEANELFTQLKKFSTDPSKMEQVVEFLHIDRDTETSSQIEMLADHYESLFKHMAWMKE